MSDFASAAMVRVLSEGMRQLGLKPPAGLDSKITGDARVALDDKRTVVMAALEQGGIGSLVLLGRGLRRFRDEPTHQALASARSGSDLFARWARLERYIHSRHRVVVEHIEEDAAGGRARLRHESGQGPQPLPAEDLVVLGVLVALLEELGLSSIHAWIGGVRVMPNAELDKLDEQVQGARTPNWTVTWDGSARRHTPPSRSRPLSLPVSEVLMAETTWPEVARDAAQRLASDLGRPPTVADLASAMKLSTRSLQRALGAAGLSYSNVLTQTRCRAAAWWLIQGDTTVAEAGFICGYSDQPHFTRDFGKRVGLTPAAFRANFGALGRLSGGE